MRGNQPHDAYPQAPPQLPPQTPPASYAPPPSHHWPQGQPHQEQIPAPLPQAASVELSTTLTNVPTFVEVIVKVFGGFSSEKSCLIYFSVGLIFCPEQMEDGTTLLTFRPRELEEKR